MVIPILAATAGTRALKILNTSYDPRDVSRKIKTPKIVLEQGILIQDNVM